MLADRTTHAAWAKSLLGEIFRHWLVASATATGIFHPHLDREWRQKEPGQASLVSQSRLIYNFSRGYTLFGDDRFGDAARTGLAALERYFRLPAGGYRWSVTIAGNEIDSSLDCYGHAFALLALSTAAAALGDTELAGHAMATWQFLLETFADPQGGLCWRIGNPREWEAGKKSQNPLMHTFEALMALAAVDKSAIDQAAKLLGFMRTLSRFTAGALDEFHTVDWRPLDSGAMLDLGHQFEWAFLLSDWYRLTGDQQALAEGQAFLKTGIEWGLTLEGGVRSSCDRAGKPISVRDGLWQQCEAIRAVARYAFHHGRTDLIPALDRMLGFYHTHFVDAEYGGVFADRDGTGRPGSEDKGNPWKLDYHTANMCLELIATD